MHWGTFVLSLEPIMEPRKRFENAEKYGFKKKMQLFLKWRISIFKELLLYN